MNGFLFSNDCKELVGIIDNQAIWNGCARHEHVKLIKNYEIENRKLAEKSMTTTTLKKKSKKRSVRRKETKNRDIHTKSCARYSKIKKRVQCPAKPTKKNYFTHIIPGWKHTAPKCTYTNTFFSSSTRNCFFFVFFVSFPSFCGYILTSGLFCFARTSDTNEQQSKLSNKQNEMKYDTATQCQKSKTISILKHFR